MLKFKLKYDSLKRKKFPKKTTTRITINIIQQYIHTENTHTHTFNIYTNTKNSEQIHTIALYLTHTHIYTHTYSQIFNNIHSTQIHTHTHIYDTFEKSISTLFRKQNANYFFAFSPPLSFFL